MIKFMNVVMLVFLICNSASAENYDMSKKWGVGLGLGKGSIINSDLVDDNYDGAFAGSVWLRYHLNSQIAFELDYSRQAYDAQNFASDIKSNSLNVSAAYRFRSTERLRPFLQAGFGFAKLNVDGPTENKKEYDIKTRIGLEYMLKPNLALAVNGDYIFTNAGSGTGSEIHTLVPMISATYYWGASEASVSAPKAATTITKKETAVVSAAIPAVVDGDSDGDGILDSKDKCKGTLKGQTVTEYGCTAEEKLEFSLNVQFSTGSSNVNSDFITDLNEFSEFMKKYLNLSAEIQGHTDNTGSRQGNISISKARADSVVSYLVKQGVASTRLKAKGFGPDQPISGNNTDEGRTKNRRVVAKINN